MDSPPTYTDSHTGAAYSQRQLPSVVQSPMMMMAPEGVPVLQPAAPEPAAFNPCICCRYCCPSQSSIRAGSQLLGVAHLTLGAITLLLWLAVQHSALPVTIDTKVQRRFLRFLRRDPVYNVFTMINIFAFYVPCGMLILIAVRMESKLFSQIYCCFSAGNIILAAVSPIARAIAMNGYKQKYYLSSMEKDSLDARITVHVVIGILYLCLEIYFGVIGFAWLQHVKAKKKRELALEPALQMPGTEVNDVPIGQSFSSST